MEHRMWNVISPFENVQSNFIMKDPFSRYMKILSSSLVLCVTIIIVPILPWHSVTASSNLQNGLLPVFGVSSMSNWTNVLPSFSDSNSSQQISLSTTEQTTNNLPPPIEQQIPPGVNLSDPNVHVVWKNVTVPANTSVSSSTTTSIDTSASGANFTYSFSIIGSIISFFSWIISVIFWSIYELSYRLGFVCFIAAIGVLIYLARSSIFASRVPIYEDEETLYKAIEQDLLWLKHEKRDISVEEDIDQDSPHRMKRLEKFKSETKASINEDKILLKLMKQEKKRYKDHILKEKKRHLKIMKELYHRLRKDLEKEKRRARIRYRIYGHIDQDKRRPDPNLAFTTVKHNTFLDRIYKYWTDVGDSYGSGKTHKYHRHGHKRESKSEIMDPLALKFILLHHSNDSYLRQNLISSISQDLKGVPDPSKKLEQMIATVKSSGDNIVKFPSINNTITDSSHESHPEITKYQQLFSVTKSAQPPYGPNRSDTPIDNDNLAQIAMSKSPEEMKQLLKYMELRVKLEKERGLQKKFPIQVEPDRNSIEQKIRHILDEEELAMAKKQLSPTTLGQLQTNQVQ